MIFNFDKAVVRFITKLTVIKFIENPLDGPKSIRANQKWVKKKVLCIHSSPLHCDSGGIENKHKKHKIKNRTNNSETLNSVEVSILMIL